MKTARELTRQYRLEQWAQIMQERSAAECVKDFCQRRGFSLDSYYYWQRKLREAAGEVLQSRTSNEMIPAGWAICEAATTGTGAVFIEIGKCRVVVNADTSREALEKVCRVLLGLC